MTAETRQITAEELLRMPDNASRYELIKGELRQVPPAGGEHGAVAMDIGTSLNNYVKADKLGRVFTAETGFSISSAPDTVRAPDGAFVKRERIEKAGRVKGYWPGAPDLAVEVVSPNDTYAQVTEKALAWLEAGTLMVLVLDLSPAARSSGSPSRRPTGYPPIRSGFASAISLDLA